VGVVKTAMTHFKSMWLLQACMAAKLSQAVKDRRERVKNKSSGQTI